MYPFSAPSYWSLIVCFFCALFSSTAAQSTCTGETSTYTSNGLSITYKNLCGKDIGAKVDFLDPTTEPSWWFCMERCVQKAPLCYGFDFTYQGNPQYNCWLMSAGFSESEAVASDHVDAALLSPDFLTSLSDDCKRLGLRGCWAKNGALRVGTSSSSSSSSQRVIAAATTVGRTGSVTIGSSTTTPASEPSATSVTSTPSSTPISSSSSGLSTGAKAGIGAGVGATVLLLLVGIVAFLLLKRRRRNSVQEPVTQTQASEKPPVDYYHRSGEADIQPQHGHFVEAELEGSNRNISPTAAQLHATYGYGELASPTEEFGGVQRHELHGSYPRYGR